MKIRPVGFESFHVDGQTDTDPPTQTHTYDEDISRFFEF